MMTPNEQILAEAKALREDVRLSILYLEILKKDKLGLLEEIKLPQIGETNNARR